MTDFLPAPPLEDRVDTKARMPVIEPAAMEQLGKQRVPVDRYSIEPKTTSSMP